MWDEGWHHASFPAHRRTTSCRVQRPERCSCVRPHHDQLTIFKNVKFFTGQICATMTAEEVFLTQFNQLDEQLQELLVKYQTEKVTGIDITKVKFYKPQARNSNILIEFQKRAESEAERQALVAASERIAQENANMIKAAKGQNDLVTAKELPCSNETWKLKRTKRKSRR